MRTLVVMRHGKATRPEESLRDVDRTLTKAGAMALSCRLPRMLRLLEGRGRSAEIWSSPARRAMETAGLLERALKDKNVRLRKGIEEHTSLLAQDVDVFLDEFMEAESDIVFVVGHVPFVEEVTETLMGTAPTFATGALLGLSVDTENDDDRLLWFAQGPVSADWKTLIGLQEAIRREVEAIEDRRQAFFDTPDDIETIHRFRTHSRSLRSILAFIRPWQDKDQNTEAQRLLRDIVRHTSRQREIDVFEKQVRDNPDSSEALCRLLRKAAAAERASLAKVLASKEVTKMFERAMALSRDVAWRRRYLTHGLPKEVVRARFDDMVASCTRELDAVRLEDADQTHDVRKRAKRARYVSELCADVLGPDAAGIAKSMNAHQDGLGEVCDARANIKLVNELLRLDPPKALAHELKAIRSANEAYLHEVLKAHAQKG